MNTVNTMTSGLMKNTLSYAIVLCALAQAPVRAADVGQWEVFETSYESEIRYANPFTDVEVNVVFQCGDQEWVVPAFWVGGNRWTVRFAAPQVGEYRFHVHAVLARDNKEALGGHLSAGRVNVTNEIVILKTGVEAAREVDPATGLMALTFSEENA